VLQPDFDPAPTEVRIHRFKYVSQCKARSCPRHDAGRGEVDTAGRDVRQIKLCALHCQIVIERERARGLKITTDATSSARRSERARFKIETFDEPFCLRRSAIARYSAQRESEKALKTLSESERAKSIANAD